MRPIWAVGLVVAGFVGGAIAAKEATKKAIIQKTIADLTWREVAPGMPVMASDVWKGPGGSHCTFNKFPKGFVVPLHKHTRDVHAVVLAGNWGSWVQGEPEKLITVGGYELIPGGLKHATKCGDAADCVIYECGPGAFDLKDLPPPPKQ